MSRLRDKYSKEVVPALMKNLGISNKMRVPRILKVVINMGVSAADKDALKGFAEQLAAMTGQKPVIIKSTKSISNFKLREGMNVGAKVTVRGERMYDFIDRLISAALPKVRDFRGLPVTSFDGRGNYTFGIKEQTIFPEIDPNTVTQIQGMDVTIVTSASSNKEARELLKLVGIPFVGK